MDAAEMTKLQVIHITGVRDYRDCESAYANLGIRHRAYSFIDNIEEAYCASDIIITRAGASAIFEAAAFGKPMILIPYPFAMSHQSGNSRVFSERGAAIMMAEKDLSAESLKKEVLGLLNDGGRRSAMAAAARSLSVPDAAGALAKEVLDMVKG
jgi:UDP-N-acetylglucosamine--N-acetylmuramyl-(pentapeptide) pyrophosphoryl-undecaprenol N-acetylglucosamine transferase